MTLAERAARAPAWRWVSGMLVHEPDGRSYRYSHAGEVPSSGAVPDLRDPATIGGIIAQLRSARREPLGYLAPVPEVGWCWISGPYDAVRFVGPFPNEALVAALEAAVIPAVNLRP
jgi:hypothetical protein